MVVAVVTGGSRGIGAATASRLAAEGWDVCIGYHVDGAAADRVVRACRDQGASAVAVAGDITDPATVEALFHAAARLGPVGALVNNAGIVAPARRVDQLDRDRVARILDVNVVAPLLCAGEAVRRMSTAHGGAGGSIVNVSSVASRLGSQGEYVDYAASKGAIDTLTRGLAAEVAREGIRVNAVRPGIIDTEIHASGGRPDRAAALAEAIPAGRPGTAEEVAATIAWLCSPAASYVTGAIVDVAGGR